MPSVDEYMNILRDIDNGNKQVSDWEATFIESILKRNPASLSPKQIDVIIRMKQKYLPVEYVPYDDGLDDIPY